MRTKLDKQKIITYLLSAAILLMLVRVGVDHFVKPLPDNNVQNFSTTEIDSLLLSSFNDYGIESGWIKKIIREKPKQDSTGYFKVQVPADLPIPVLITGIEEKFEGKNIRITSKEMVVNGQTIVSLMKGKKVICRTEFDVDKLLVRKAAEFSFILNRFYDLSEGETERILSIPEKFAAVLIPSQNSVKIKDKIVNSEKEYVVLLTDNIDEPNFKIEDGFETSRVKNAVSEIIKTFGNAKLFLIDDGSKLYKSAVSNLVNNEFKKRKLPLVKISAYSNIQKKDGQDINLCFQKLCESNTSGEKKVFMVNAEDFTNLTKAMEKYRDKGYKFVLPSAFNFNL